LSVDSTDPASILLHVRRGYDGTNDRYIQQNNGVRDVYKLLNYEACYEGFMNDPTDPTNSLVDNFFSIKYNDSKSVAHFSSC